jgi:hypothetical protein
VGKLAGLVELTRAARERKLIASGDRGVRSLRGNIAALDFFHTLLADARLQVEQLERAVESMYNALSALGEVARDSCDGGVIAVLNEYGYRPLKRELQAQP